MSFLKKHRNWYGNRNGLSVSWLIISIFTFFFPLKVWPHIAWSEEVWLVCRAVNLVFAARKAAPQPLQGRCWPTECLESWIYICLPCHCSPVLFPQSSNPTLILHRFGTVCLKRVWYSSGQVLLRIKHLKCIWSPLWYWNVMLKICSDQAAG